MRVFIDTNILISSALNPNGTPYKAYIKAVSYPNRGIISDTNIEELRRIFNRKFPSKINALDAFLAAALMTLELVDTPSDALHDEEKIRDIKDRPIFRAAIFAKADYILTGDKDFLESGIQFPKAITAAEFLRKDI